MPELAPIVEVTSGDQGLTFIIPALQDADDCIDAALHHFPTI